MRELAVIAPGSVVSVPIGEIREAIVQETIIYPGGAVYYKISYWMDGDRKEVVVNSCEVELDPPEFVRVGFITPKREA